MTRYPIYPTYDFTQSPVGFVDLDDSLSDDVLGNCVISPTIKIHPDNRIEVISYGIFPREQLDTNPRPRGG